MTKWKLDPSGRYLEPRPLRVLVADDEPDALSMLKLLLADEGHDVVGVHGGGDVLSALHDFDPDVVMLDIAMPEKSGFELAAEIRRRCGEIRPLLIAISGRYKKPSDRLLSEIVGFNHHVVKPYDPKALLELLRF